MERLAAQQLTEEEAIALAESGWWIDQDAVTLAQFQLAQEVLCMDFGAFHAAVETALGRPVWTHEFVDPDRLWDELHEHRTPPTMADIIAMIPAEKRIIFLT